MEKKYRLGYDRVFSAHPTIKKENELIASLSIYIKYKLFDMKFSNFEIAFSKEDQAIGKGVRYISEYAEIGDYYMSDFLKCSFDKNYEGYIKFEEIDKEKLKLWGYRMEYEISSYSKDIFINERCSCAEPKEISKEEFYKILSENIRNFDNTDNTLWAQTCSYIAYPIED